MKKAFAMLLVISLLTMLAGSALAVNFDMTPFESSPDFDIELDDMDGSGSIELTNGSSLFAGQKLGDNDDGMIAGLLSVKFIEDLPPFINLFFYYSGSKKINVDEVIIKPSDTRYTFDVDSDVDTSNGKVVECFNILITPNSKGLIEELIDDSEWAIAKCRFVGDRDLDFELVIHVDSLKKLYDAYVESGAFDNDFSIIDVFCPCEIR